MMTAPSTKEQEAIINDVSMRMASSQLSRKYSRGSNGQSSGLKRRSARIEKPRSIHDSPQGLERRKTTTAIKQYVSLEDRYESFGWDRTESTNDRGGDRKPMQRPMSWHPSSTQTSSFSHRSLDPQPSFASQPQEVQQPPLLPQIPVGNAYVHDLMSQYNIQVNIDNNAMNDHSYQYVNERSSDWQNYNEQKFAPTHAIPTSLANPYESLSWYPDWAYPTQMQPLPQIQTVALPVDFLPIQHPAQQEWIPQNSKEHLMPRKASNELIGVGLYDPPDINQSMLGSSGGHATGKGLKLEETWHPPGEDDEEDADDASSADSEEEPPVVNEQQWPLQIAPQLLPNMSGQSFFFEEDESCADEWWFQQLKQPSVQNAGLGYGWL